MKRARMSTRAEAVCARARPCPVLSDDLLALLDDADATVGQLCASTSALASLTADLVARNNEWVQQALSQVVSTRSALLARKTRVLGSAKRVSRKHCKRIVTDLEAADVSTEQVRVWAVVAGAVTACHDLDCAFAASPLLASPRLGQAPVVGLSSIFELRFSGELGRVATGDGLRVVSAAGPGLKWFEPHSRNEFSVVLAQADGSVPVWLTTDDVGVEVLPLVDPRAAGAWVGAAAVQSEWVRHGTVSVVYGGLSGDAPEAVLQLSVRGAPIVGAAAGVLLSAAAAVPSECVRHGTVTVAYGGLSEDAPEAVLQLSVCGVPVADDAVDSNWCVHVPRKPLAGHKCAAVGTHVRTLAIVKGAKFGMAVSADEKWLVVGLACKGTLSVYSLPVGELVRTFAGEGVGPLQFSYYLCRLCFAPNGNLVVVDRGNKRLQEVTLEGVFVRFIGVGQFGDGSLFCVVVHDDVIAVGCVEGTGPRVVLFDFVTGAVTSRFGEVGPAPGQLSVNCSGIRFTPDGSHVIVAEGNAKRVSLFTSAGVFVRCVGVGVLAGGCNDVLLSVSGEFVVADDHNDRVCVFSPDGSELVRSWGVAGAGDGQFRKPTALAAARHILYVMDVSTGRVQVFE